VLNDDQDHLKDSIIAELLERADIQGYISIEDLMEVCPDDEEDEILLKSILLALKHGGVELLDHETLKAGKSESETRDNNRRPVSIEKIRAEDTVGLYLKEMSRVPLLKVKEEVNLAKRIEVGKLAKTELEGACKTHNKKRLSELKDQIYDGEQAWEHLIKANTRLVVSIAKRYMGRGVPFLDLIQEGNLGLIKAVDKFDYTRGFRFSTYATWWIRQAISRSIADHGRTIRIPVHMIDRIRQLYKINYALEQKLGRKPNPQEIASEMSTSARKVQWMIRVSWLPLSLESPVGEEDESEFGMFIRDDTTPSPMEVTYKTMLRDKIDEVLSTLTPREARILRLRFGLDNGRSYTLEEVGKKFDLTRERIRQIEGNALRRLRHPKRSGALRDYL